jgi:hypothetical protein
MNSIRNTAPRYKVTVYRKVDKFIDSIPEPARKRDAILAINDLASFPFSSLGFGETEWKG